MAVVMAPGPEYELHVAHMQFMDVVAYSQLDTSEQARRRGDLIRLPTGDGMALFFGDPTLPARCLNSGRANQRSRVRLPIPNAAPQSSCAGVWTVLQEKYDQD